MRRSLFVFLTACPAPAPAPVAVTALPTAPAAPTCAEAGVILRGDVDLSVEAAGTEREHAIQSACEQDHWSPSILRCVAGMAHATDCIDKLSPAQHASYEARLKVWSDKYAPIEPAPPEPMLTCEEALHNSDFMQPVLDDASAERAWQSELRHRDLVATCERDGWNPRSRSCLAVATTPDAIDACLTAELDPAVLERLHKRFDEVAAHAKAIAALKQTPAKMDCKRVVDAYYADAKWRTKSTPDQRKESRTALLTACKNESWDDSRRACMIVGRSDCANDLRWDYPAISSACAEYTIAVERMLQCTALPLVTRDALKQAFDVARYGTWKQQDHSREAACRSGADAVIAVLKSASC